MVLIIAAVESKKRANQQSDVCFCSCFDILPRIVVGNSATVLPCCRNGWKRLRVKQGNMRKRVLLSAMAAVILIAVSAY